MKKLIAIVLLFPTICFAGNWLDKSRWKLVSVTSEQTVGHNEAAINAFDNDPNTHWFSEWSPPENQVNHPQSIQIDLGAEYTIDAIRYLPRQCTASYCANGRIKDYKVYASKTLQWGEPVKSGQWANSIDEKAAYFEPVEARYVRLDAISEANGHPSYTMAAEIGIREFGIQKIPFGKDLKITFDPSPDEMAIGHNLFIDEVKHDLGEEVSYTIPKEALIRNKEYVFTATAYGECRFCNEDAELSPCAHDPNKMCCYYEDSHLGPCESVHSEELRLLVVDEIIEPGETKLNKPVIKKITIGALQ